MTWLYEILGYPFGIVLKGIYAVIPNYAVAIILLTLFTRFLLIPSSISQQKGMAKTQRIQPKIRRINEKYAGDQRKIQEETQALYQREGYNPMNAGCTPMLFQFILLFGLIGAIYYPLSHFLFLDADQISILKEAVGANHSDLVKQNSIQIELYIVKYIDELKEMFANGQLKGVTQETLDKIAGVNFKFLGINLGDIPNDFKVFSNRIWAIPVLSFLSSMATGVYSWIKSKKQNPEAAKNPTMGCMTFFMPLLSLYFVINFPAGIGIYWIASSVFGFASTIILNYFYSPKNTLTSLMIDETVERRSREAYIKRLAKAKNKDAD